MLDSKITRTIAAGIMAAAALFATSPAAGQLPGHVTRHQAAAVTRPVWDGRGTYDSGIEPLCPASLAGHAARAGDPGHLFTVTCAWDGSEWAWSVTR